MPGPTPNPAPADPLDPLAWLAAHPRIAIIVLGFCIWVSATLLLRIWILHRRQRFRKKLIWSFIVLIPLFGWIFYGGLFTVPDFHDMPCSQNVNTSGGGYV